jgi:Rad3-related DNA helicase
MEGKAACVLTTCPENWWAYCCCQYQFNNVKLRQANVIIYNYHYLLDPKVAEMISRDLSKDSIVVFDEAHNIGELMFISRRHRRFK